MARSAAAHCLDWAADCCTATLDASAVAEKHIDCSSQAGVGAAKTIMMTMIPVDYHTCFIAISPHAKILYANESMASLLGRKVTEISGKMSLPQLMTIPCQQLHQNFFKVGTLLTPVVCMHAPMHSWWLNVAPEGLQGLLL